MGGAGEFSGVVGSGYSEENKEGVGIATIWSLIERALCIHVALILHTSTWCKVLSWYSRAQGGLVTKRGQHAE